MLIARKITIVIAATNEGAYEEALAEATRLVNQGNLSGANSNEEGGFSIDSTTDVPDTELPRL